ncbi:polysaccharide biosynthesis protein [Epilithonimonas hungarica]|uniref:NDP-sugar epimerase, includes UDP-GlcNAc-inverting 4,6-dehydratase FlaA1 and capsular polysaccharide biosynthesis protein EpsC n=1 Tax=Epilithonimonas hungarica TaxID=454006 RepID=A0A1G7MZW4_9FLAO|nr:nucleoside-diphosphate sugar epimerase/dehydratase [Epilithonimonas hungarica]SDF67314.1 NDP-sugar epimerase, includes UDP-GlcNAc-inverting 4,6-dehydratase FlaA1 and capsular polysaccharide biosynthesis protein EpsC [Epilithonimonas hungarica]
MEKVKDLKKFSLNDNVLDLIDLKFLPRWVILFIDILIILVSLFISHLLIMGLEVKHYRAFPLRYVFLFILSTNVLYMYIFKTYLGVIRHSTFVDLFKLFFANLCCVLTIVIVNYTYYFSSNEKAILIPFLGFYFALSSVFLFVFRLCVKGFFNVIKENKRSASRKKIYILGDDDTSVAIAQVILSNPNLPFDIKGFISYNDRRVSIKLLDKNIATKANFINSLNTGKKEVDGVLVIKEALQKEELDFWVNLLLEHNIKIYKAPSLQKLRGKETISQIKTIQIEDLLNRKQIKLDNVEVKRRHFQKTVLVTGGAGSIGREIVRQVALLEPMQIIILDQSETPLYDTELEMKETYPHINFKFILADISNITRLEPLFNKYSFSMVYHAAAYKHVPLVEDNPHEAVLVNVLGTKNLALLSHKYKVNRFVMVSTDKAVNPTNVMGASKRVAELFVQSLQNLEGNTTKFITTRFGNVLGSNGSVIPHFRRQIEKGGPVTITHPDIVRYFMTIAEACELVLNAGTMGSGGEIYVFDMGDPVKILELAKRMIKLSGFEPDIDIKIIYTGLRPGEKLYEELLSDNARTLPTSHEKIMISKDPSMLFEEIDELTELVIEFSRKEEKQEIVRVLKSIVKEFKSNNSIYESLDK